MSIFISIPCLFVDDELLNTIKSAKDNSSNPDLIHIGISFTGSKEFNEYIVDEINKLNYSNIKTIYLPFEEAIGIYYGRTAAQSLYDNQDYFLQVDSHTFFTNGWDITLIKGLSRAIKKTKNKKTIITAVPGNYGYSDSVPDFFNNSELKKLVNVKYIGDLWYWNTTGFSLYEKDEFALPNNKLPKFADYSAKSISKDLYKKVNKYGIAPAIKICAAFTFGNKNFAKFSGIEKNTFFWEEEILQTINLIGDGFSIAHLGPTAPLSHKFRNDQIEKSRISIIGDLINLDTSQDIITKNYLNYYHNPENKLKIKKYEGYANFDYLNGANESNFFPKKFINKKFFI